MNYDLNSYNQIRICYIYTCNPKTEMDLFNPAHKV